MELLPCGDDHLPHDTISNYCLAYADWLRSKCAPSHHAGAVQFDAEFAHRIQSDCRLITRCQFQSFHNCRVHLHDCNPHVPDMYFVRVCMCVCVCGSACVHSRMHATSSACTLAPTLRYAHNTNRGYEARSGIPLAQRIATFARSAITHRLRSTRRSPAMAARSPAHTRCPCE